MFKIKIGNYGIVNINRLPENKAEYDQITNARKGKESVTIQSLSKATIFPLFEEKLHIN